MRERERPHGEVARAVTGPVPRRLVSRPPPTQRQVRLVHLYYLALVVAPLAASVACSGAVESGRGASSLGAWLGFWLVGLVFALAGLVSFPRLRAYSFAAAAWNVVALALVLLLALYGMALRLMIEFG